LRGDERHRALGRAGVTRRDFMQQVGAATAGGLLGAACHPAPTNVAGSILAPVAGVRSSTGHTFENWSHTISFRPRRFCEPRTEADVVAVVRDALATKTHVRTQGAGHSFAQLLPTSDTLLTLDDLSVPITVDGHRVTVSGGIRLKNLIPELRARGLGLKNLGSITEQSIAGAFSTGTHGTGVGLGAIPTQVVGMRLVDGHGDLRTITEQDIEHLSAARINVGALGIITQVTLECVEDYQLEYSAYLTTLEAVLRHIDQLVQENDRVLFWWLLPPGHPRDTVVLITKNSVGHPISDVLKQPSAAAIQSSRQVLSKEPGTLRKVATQARKDDFKRIIHYVGPYNQVLTIPLLPVFHRECEYAIPIAKTVEAITAMRDFVEEGDLSLLLPVEVRFVAKDDILLSPCLEGPVSYIGASTLVNSTEVFERFEPLMKRLGGRPHWGKNYTITREEAMGMYPSTYKRFCDVRDAFDPNRVFANSMLTDLFG
jgi:L-gulono-1,4-lactone dehydrogenase